MRVEQSSHAESPFLLFNVGPFGGVVERIMHALDFKNKDFAWEVLAKLLCDVAFI